MDFYLEMMLAITLFGCNTFSFKTYLIDDRIYNWTLLEDNWNNLKRILHNYFEMILRGYLKRI